MSDFKVTRYRIRTGEGQRGTQKPFTAVMLSDLHNTVYGNANSRLLQAIRNENPELVFVAGDMLTATDELQMDAALNLMDELTKQYPVYYVNGNHEYRLKYGSEKSRDSYENYSDKIKSFGVHLLEDTCERAEINKMPLCIWGFELSGDYYQRFRRCELTKDQISEKIGEPDTGCYNILLAHHPLYFDAYASWGADLTLSGHLHGGIIRLPYFGGVISPQFRLFPRYDRGLYTQMGKKMIVSAGLGSHTIPIRVNNPPELVVLDFT